MDSTVMVAVIGSIPATIAASAAVLAAKRSKTGNNEVSEVRALLEHHMNDGTLHFMPERRPGAVRKEGRG